jgi:hypothetical protein
MAKTPVKIAPRPMPYLNPFLSMSMPAGSVNSTWVRGKTSVNHITSPAGILSRSSIYVSMAAKFSQNSCVRAATYM